MTTYSTKNGLHIDTRTATEAYADGHAQGVRDLAEVAGNDDAIQRRVKFCATMAEQNKGTRLGHVFQGRLDALREA